MSEQNVTGLIGGDDSHVSRTPIRESYAWDGKRMVDTQFKDHGEWVIDATRAKFDLGIPLEAFALPLDVEQRAIVVAAIMGAVKIAEDKIETSKQDCLKSLRAFIHDPEYWGITDG